MNQTKQIIGIDISKDTFNACYGTFNTDGSKVTSKPRVFINNIEGFKELINWKNQHIDKTKSPVLFVMEATGVYYEKLAYFLSKHKQLTSVILPN